MTTLGPARYRAQLGRDLSRLDELLAGPDAPWAARPVPACPGWDLATLVGHLGGVHRMVRQAVESGTRSHSRQHGPPAGTALAPWLQDGGRALLAVLDADPDTPAWSFHRASQTVGFWQRRQALETVVHRVDVEQALGARTPAPADLAGDGVAEVVDLLIPLRTEQGALTLPGYAVELRAADSTARWRIGAGPVAGTVTAPAEALFLGLWKRGPATDGLTVDGDPAAVRSLLELPLTP